MAFPDDGVDDKPAVTLRCLDNGAVGVRLSGQEPFDEGCVQYVVEAWAPGLIARVDEVVAWIWDADLAAFIAGLAADYQGLGRRAGLAGPRRGRGGVRRLSDR